MRSTCLLLALLGLGCASPARLQPVSESPISTMAPGQNSTSGARRVRLDAHPVVPTAVPAAPSLRRADLDRVLDQGPGALLQQVPLEPHFSAVQPRRFVGFRIARVFDNSPEVLRFGVLPGDQLRAINGQAVTTPDQLMAVFNRLRNATEVQISLTRDGRPVEVRWPVLPARAPAQPAPAGQPAPTPSTDW